MPSTAAGSGGGSQPTATATSARCTVGQDTPVLAGDLVDGTVGSGHGTGEVLPPPCGQPRPRRDRGGGPGERPSPARALQAAQAAQAPPQLHPPPRGGQIPGSLPAAGPSPAHPQRGHQPVVRLVSITTRSPRRRRARYLRPVKESRPNSNHVGLFMPPVASPAGLPQNSQHAQATIPTHAPTPRSKLESRVTRPLGHSVRLRGRAVERRYRARTMSCRQSRSRSGLRVSVPYVRGGNARRTRRHAPRRRPAASGSGAVAQQPRPSVRPH
jgi:hypothetical protein